MCNRNPYDDNCKALMKSIKYSQEKKAYTNFTMVWLKLKKWQFSQNYALVVLVQEKLNGFKIFRTNYLKGHLEEEAGKKFKMMRDFPNNY